MASIETPYSSTSFRIRESSTSMDRSSHIALIRSGATDVSAGSYQLFAHRISSTGSTSVRRSTPNWKPGSGLWAPDIARIDGQYVLYYSLTRFGDPNPGIGIATADSPTETFVDQGKLL